MINETMYGLGSKSSVIRELFAYGLEKKKVVGEDKVYDFSLGNPSIPAPVSYTHLDVYKRQKDIILMQREPMR